MINKENKTIISTVVTWGFTAKHLTKLRSLCAVHLYVTYWQAHLILNGKRCAMLQTVSLLFTNASTEDLSLWYLRIFQENPPVKSLSLSSTDFWGSISTRPSSTPTTSATGTETLITQTNAHSTHVSGHVYFNHYPHSRYTGSLVMTYWDTKPL